MSNPEEYRRACRLVDLLLRIHRQPRRWTRRDLAAHYEVSERQIDKDLQALRHGLRIPLCHVPQGYYIERLAVLPALSLSLPEALSLLLAARPAREMPGVSGGDLAAAIGRLETVLPRELQPLVEGLRGPVGPRGSRETMLQQLQLAIAERTRLRIVYLSASGPDSRLPKGDGRGDGREDLTPLPPSRRGKGDLHPLPKGEGRGEGLPQNPELRTQNPSQHPPRDRLVDPYTLLPHQRSWYLVAHCHLRGEIRIFKVDRIQSLSRTGDRFAFPEDFDLAGYLGPIWGIVRGQAGEPEEVVVEFAPQAAPWIRDQDLHSSQVVEDLPDGGVRFTFHVGVTPELRRWVLGFGRQARVVRPAHLAEWVLEEARAVGEREDDQK